MKKLAYLSNWGVRLTFEEGSAANIDRAIEIEVDHVLIELAHQQARHRLVADAQHLRTIADGGDVLVAPTNLVIETQTRNGCAIGVELHPLGVRHIIAKVFREWHFDSGD